ncbi:MAG TPA: DUF427 domain-containing protein [Acetobacteraceae bacterium]|nr:DUF427 domain-containing protein [Acetobacteraceae bacterium]
MKATLGGTVIAESEDISEAGGYLYFPPGSVRRDLLEKSPKTDSDHACPHGVQFYDVVLNGTRHPRNAWVYESPQPKLAHIAGRFGFWDDVAVG